MNSDGGHGSSASFISPFAKVGTGTKRNTVEICLNFSIKSAENFYLSSLNTNIKSSTKHSFKTVLLIL